MVSVCVPVAPHPRQHFVKTGWVFCGFNVGVLMDVHLSMAFVCVCCRWWCPASFHGLLCRLPILFSEVSVRVLCPFSSWIACFFYCWIWECFIYSRYYSLSDMWFANIVSQSVVCLSRSSHSLLWNSFLFWWDPIYQPLLLWIVLSSQKSA